MKKYLSLMLVGLFGVVGFASADTVDGFTSDTQICSAILDNTEYVGNNGDGDCSLDYSNDTIYACVSSNDYPYTVSYYPIPSSSNQQVDSVSTSYHCFVNEYGEYTVDFSKEISGKYYYSASPITYSSSSDSNGSSDSDLGLGLNAGLNSAITSGVSSFTAGLGQRVPTLMLIGLPILVVLVFWRKIYRFVRRVFRRH